MASSGVVSFYNEYNTVTFFAAFKPSETATYKGVKYVGLIASGYLVALVDTVARTLFTVFIAPVAAIYFAATHNEEGLNNIKLSMFHLGISAAIVVGLPILSPIAIPVLMALPFIPDSDFKDSN